MAADPDGGDAWDQQSFNRYSYVLNNPLSFTDPTGLHHKPSNGLGAALISVAVAATLQEWLLPVVEGELAIASSTALDTINAALAGGIGNFAGTGNLKSGLIGAGEALAFAGVHGIKSGLDFPDAPASYSPGQILASAGMHGFVGGLASIAGGGKFKSGFLAAAFSDAAGGVDAGRDDTIGMQAANVAIHAITGGVGSILGGGKFANGAVTGTFGYLFNDLASNLGEQIQDMLREGNSDPSGINTAYYHVYQTDKLLICVVGQSGCSFSNVHASVMATEVPGYDGGTVDKGRYPVTIAVAGYIGDVQVRDTGATVYNITLRNHWLWFGYVARTISMQGNRIYLSTFGEGANYNALEALGNAYFGPRLFSRQDADTRRYFYRHFGSTR
jgi:hypothetical protein